MAIVIFGDSYEYEVHRDDRTLFIRTSKWERLRLEQTKQSTKRRRIEKLNEDSKIGTNESDDDEDSYVDSLADRVRRIYYIRKGVALFICFLSAVLYCRASRQHFQ